MDQLVEDVTVDLEVISSSFMLGIRITKKGVREKEPCFVEVMRYGEAK